MKKAPDTTKAASSAPDTAQFTGTALLALAFTAIENAALRAWCATPSSWGRATVRPGAEHTKSEAADLPDSEVFSRPEFMVLGVGSRYPQGRGHRFGGVFKPHVHPAGLNNRRMVFATPEGVKAMTTSPVASRSAAPTITFTAPTTRTDSTSEEARAFALLQASSDATMAKLYLSRGNVPAARRKAVQLLKALQLLERSEVASTSAAMPASACTHCRDNFPLPNGPLDFFDTHVVADYIQRRSACTLCPPAQKPCMKKGGAA